MHSDKGSGTALDRASRSLPAFIAGELLGGLLVGVLAGRRPSERLRIPTLDLD